MPAVSKKQQRFFGYLLSNPEERKKKGISKKAAKDFAKDVQEVAPPGWGHTKAEKEKTKPNKPKSKIGGSAAAFKRALDDGRFKGLPGDKTKKEKTASMFKLMWSMKKKGDKPHYKPGTDEKKKKYQDESFEINPKAHKTAQKKAKIRNLARGNENPNEKAAAEKRLGPKLVGEAEMSPMQDNNLFGNAYAGTKPPKKKKKKLKEGRVEASYSGGQATFSDFYDRAKEARKAMARKSAKKIEYDKKNAEVTSDTRKHGVKFSDKKGSGRIVKGKKRYD